MTSLSVSLAKGMPFAYSSNGVRIEKTPFRVDWDISQAEKGGYPHFMLKEIYEQPKALTDTVRPRVKGSSIVLDKMTAYEPTSRAHTSRSVVSISPS